MKWISLVIAAHKHDLRQKVTQTPLKTTKNGESSNRPAGPATISAKSSIQRVTTPTAKNQGNISITNRHPVNHKQTTGTKIINIKTSV